MTFPRDAWILRRLLADLPLNGELDTMTGALKSMAGHLAEIPPEGRQPAWDRAVEKSGFAGANHVLAFRSICCAVGAPLMPA